MVDPTFVPRRSTRRPERFDGRIGRPFRDFDGAAYDPVAEWKQHACPYLGSGKHARCQPALQLRVTLGFMTVAALIGCANGSSAGVSAVVVLASTVFVHELARALLARSFERSSRICMSASGGETELLGPPIGGVPSMLFAIIGSSANALIALLAFSIVHGGVGADSEPVFRLVLEAHAVWGVAQLLPLGPFHVGTALSKRFAPAARFAHAAASAAFVIAMSILAMAHDYPPAIVGLSVFASTGAIRALREAHREMLDSHMGLDTLLRDASLALANGCPDRAQELAERGLARAFSAQRRQALWKTLAWSGIGLANPFLAHGALLRLPADGIDVHLLASYLACCNRIDEAVEILQGARRAGQGKPECARLLADLLFRRGDREAVLALARDDASTLTAEDRNAIEVAVTSLQSA